MEASSGRNIDHLCPCVRKPGDHPRFARLDGDAATIVIDRVIPPRATARRATLMESQRREGHSWFSAPLTRVTPSPACSVTDSGRNSNVAADVPPVIRGSR